jgi:hypothetical protein
MVLVPHRLPTVVSQPGNGLFELPSAFVTADLTAVLRRHQVESLLLEPAPTRIAIISPVCDQGNGAILDGHLCREVFDKRDL